MWLAGRLVSSLGVLAVVSAVLFTLARLTPLSPARIVLGATRRRNRCKRGNTSAASTGAFPPSSRDGHTISVRRLRKVLHHREIDRRGVTPKRSLDA